MEALGAKRLVLVRGESQREEDFAGESIKYQSGIGVVEPVVKRSPIATSSSQWRSTA